MPERLTRRDFLKATASVVTGVLASEISKKIELPFPQETPRNLDEIWKIEFNGELGFDEYSQIAKRFNRVARRLPDLVIPASQESAELILAEYNNFFQINGISEGVYYPQTIEFKILSPSRHTSVLGSTNCSDKMTFNFRQINPLSAWYNRKDWLWTVVHESAHIHQGVGVCSQGGVLGDKTLIETTAELMTAEVMASCAVRKDKQAFIVLTNAIDGWAFGASLAEAIKEKNIDIYRQLLVDTGHGAMSLSTFEALLRKYRYQMRDLEELLVAYEETPLKTAIEGTKNPRKAIPNLALRPRIGYGYGSNEAQPPELIVDDLAYFVQHLEEMANDLFQ